MSGHRGFVGADPEELDRLAALFRQEAADMREVASSSSWAIMISAWTGNHIEQLRERWKRESRPAILGAAEQLEQLALDLARNAEQQRRASLQGSTSRARHEPYLKPPGIQVRESGVREASPPCSLNSLLEEVG